MRILIVEDDKDLSQLIAMNLKREGYTVDICWEGDEGLRLMREQSHDLVLLDRMLPAVDGMTILHAVRRENIFTPVLMMTALGGASERITGFDSGADDYIEKPFVLEELFARIRALQRRSKEIHLEQVITAEGLQLKTTDRQLVCKENNCSLSKRETDLLEILMKNFNKTLPRSILFSYVWGVDAEVEDGNLDNYISYVRDRLRCVGSDLAIRTVRGVGYRLERKNV